MTEQLSQFQGQLTRIVGTAKISMAVRNGSGSATREISATGKVTMELTSIGLCGKQIIQPMVQLKISSKWVWCGGNGIMLLLLLASGAKLIHIVSTNWNHIILFHNQKISIFLPTTPIQKHHLAVFSINIMEIEKGTDYRKIRG